MEKQPNRKALMEKIAALEANLRTAQLDPDVRAIVSSGYSNDPVMANYAHYGFRGAVKKPYLVQEMSRVLNEVIKG
jgi:DNA-binding NarL/FixJ family response regulator